jgi:Rps23 Pro-64 3,4-dihydroxylase Tpa1-like proline 4-hydroxylase
MTLLNPELDIRGLAKQYVVDDRLRIPDLLKTDFAEQVYAACRHDVPYEYLCYVDGQNLVIPPDAFEELPPEDQQDLKDKVVDNASKGVGFFYSGYQMRRANRATTDAKLAFLHRVFEFVNSHEMLEFMQVVTQQDDLKGADLQYTRYTTGHFLTRHKDDITSEGRRIAYVLGFSRHWHPDWGGLLQFFEDDGTPRDAWLPAFNTLSIFDVRHIHSVTYVTPFAREPRLSLTGWFYA